MKRIATLRPLAAIMALLILFTSCSSNTLIQTEPPGAKIYMDGEYMGTTPYSHTDTKIVGSTTNMRFEKEGYETLHAPLTRNEQVDVGALVGGLFVFIPFLWIMKYKSTHTYELRSN